MAFNLVESKIRLSLVKSRMLQLWIKSCFKFFCEHHAPEKFRSRKTRKAIRQSNTSYVCLSKHYILHSFNHEQTYLRCRINLHFAIGCFFVHPIYSVSIVRNSLFFYFFWEREITAHFDNDSECMLYSFSSIDWFR